MSNYTEALGLKDRENRYSAIGNITSEGYK